MDISRVINPNNILVVEDSEEYQHLVKMALSKSYKLTVVETCSAGFDAIKNHSFDAILLDLNLPDGDGFRLCSYVKNREQSKDTPIICITSKSSIEDKAMGFSLGIIDYLTKPFDPLELKLRLDAKLNFIKSSVGASSLLQVSNLIFHIPTQKVFVIDNDEKTEIFLTSLEFRLIHHLACHPDFIYSREQLLDTVWGNSVAVLDRSVDSCVAKIRTKLGKSSAYLKSVHGVGYKFSSE